MSGQVSGKAAFDLAYLAYDQGVKAATPNSEHIRMQVAPGVPFDLILHGKITAKRLVTIARLLDACAALLEDNEPDSVASPAAPDTASPDTQPDTERSGVNQTILPQTEKGS